MNKTTKATYDLAASMLKGNIPESEVHLMTGLSLEEISKLKFSLRDEIQDRNAMRGIDPDNVNIKL